MSTRHELFPDVNPKKLKNVSPPPWLIDAALQKVGILPAREEGMEETSINSSPLLVVYGRKGNRFTPRVWYDLCRCSCEQITVKLLQGSLEEWIEDGGPAEYNSISSSSSMILRAKDLVEEYSNYDKNKQKSIKVANHYVNMQYVVEYLDHRKTIISNNDQNNLVRPLIMKELAVEDAKSKNKWPSLIIDTRGSSFTKNGHIPGSIHLPYSSLSKESDPLKLKSKIELKRLLVDSFITNDVISNKVARSRNNNGKNTNDVDFAVVEEFFEHNGPPLLSCGTGVSVCTMALVFKELGLPDPFIYDGSWDEYGQDPSTPKNTIKNESSSNNQKFYY